VVTVATIVATELPSPRSSSLEPRCSGEDHREDERGDDGWGHQGRGIAEDLEKENVFIIQKYYG
jgi:hypothetical protein